MVGESMVIESALGKGRSVPQTVGEAQPRSNSVVLNDYIRLLVGTQMLIEPLIYSPMLRIY